MRKHVAHAVITLVVLIGLAAPARAQLCEGYVSYREAPFQITPGAWFGSDFRQVGVFASAGGDNLYGGVGVGHHSFRSNSAWSVETQIGYEIPLDSGGRMFVCPKGAFAYTNGSFDNGIGVSGTSVRFGGSFGVVAARTSRVMIVPNAAFGVAMARSTPEGFAAETTTDPFLGVGVGIVVDNRVTISPAFDIPIGRDESWSGMAFGIHVGFNFGQ